VVCPGAREVPGKEIMDSGNAPATPLSHRSDSRPRIIALVGPTGSGKTALGLVLARALNTEIISVDAMAVYRHMDIGTAKPTRAEQQAARHHLIDVVEPDQPFTAADFATRAHTVIERLHREGRPALLVGGTGLYLRALIHGLFQGPPTNPDYRATLMRSVAPELEAGDECALHRRLAAVDPTAAARLHPRDHVRIVRALEVYHLTGRPLSAWQAEHRFAEERYRWIKLALAVDRPTLYRRIDQRVLHMVEAGFVAEVRWLLDRFGPAIKPMKGLGYAQFSKYLLGEYDLAEAIRLTQRDTRRFARRQHTWFRKETGVRWIHPDPSAVLNAVRSSGLLD